MASYRFSCGCEWPILEGVPHNGDIPALDFNIDDAPSTCPATWAMLGNGESKGVFQLESKLGRQWSKKLRPESIEHMGALGALLRPGCISGDTQIRTNMRPRTGRRTNSKTPSIRELYEKFKRNHVNYQNGIVSVDEQLLSPFNNEIEDVIYSGEKEVFFVKFAVGRRTRGYDYNNGGFYNLECTEDHLLLTHDRGWIQLKDILLGERIAVLRTTKKLHPRISKIAGQKSFRDICHHTFAYSCIHCDWKDGSLDVNHLDGNRNSNNDADNLCFMCPNHHRMYSEGTITKEVAIAARERFRLRNSEQTQWVEYAGCESRGIKDTYDITVVGPHHNFIAGNVIVHNCLKAVDSDGISMTSHYARRKNGEEPVAKYHPIIDAILAPTYGVLTYQEQSMAISQQVAAFTLQEADMLRKSIGKKDAESMSKCKTMFMDGAKKAGVLTDEQATEVFGWIQKSQRYSFNCSHAISYGIVGYQCAYIKAHFPLIFYTSWLKNADDKEEVYELVQDAKLFDIAVEPPHLVDGNVEFDNNGKSVQFGISNISGVGPAVVKKLLENLEEAQLQLHKPLDKFDWVDFLCFMTGKGKTPSDVMKSFIRTGTLRWLGTNRRRMEAEYEAWSEITDTPLKWAAENRQKMGWRTVEEALYGIAKTKKNGGGCHSQPVADKLISQIRLLETPPTSLEDTPHWIAWAEEALLGISLSCSELDACDLSQVNVSCRDYMAGQTGFLIFGVKVESVRAVKTKKGKNPGQLMAFLSLSDQSCALEDVVCFPDVWKEFGAHLTEGALVIIQGERGDGNSLMVKKVWPAT